MLDRFELLKKLNSFWEWQINQKYFIWNSIFSFCSRQTQTHRNTYSPDTQWKGMEMVIDLVIQLMRLLCLFCNHVWSIREEIKVGQILTFYNGPQMKTLVTWANQSDPICAPLILSSPLTLPNKYSEQDIPNHSPFNISITLGLKYWITLANY